ncbi:DUF58 domain-containing protein [Psychromarinibacter halotolerans]|uniref:DUF58 domain-containing protein n=1 Tax=Psychromarinibacter halotolerans TaxID=1775175 RepID=A0ABV7GQ12_9RHOB|nr:DUF58 domain-containing protein [Psychromarinibacter halotolerans]MDF0597805.1 DUF58 domain-containing protein [Psychromarinibacter halotolerans]
MTSAAGYRQRSETLAGPLPPLLAEAEHLAQAVLMGFHGRRRGGMGDEFWQYRPARAGDAARSIDWRRSGRSDMHFVQEKEWQAAQSVFIWLDEARSMDFTGEKNRVTKIERARVLALAIAILLIRGGERVALASLGTPPRSSELQLLRIAQSFELEEDRPDYGAPEVRNLLPHSRALFVSDFMGDLAPLETQLAKAADRGVRGVLYQVLDPMEEAFPFDGRTIFESMGQTVRHETLKAGDLKDRYLERLAERKARLDELAQVTGWQYACHHTGDSAQSALLWIYGALEHKL